MYKKIVTTLCLSLTLVLQAQEKYSAAEVSNHIKEFNNTWKDDLAYDSEFGVQNLVKTLNLDYPGFENVKKYVTEKDWENVEASLLVYFKEKYKHADIKVSKLYPDEIEGSESALKHYFRGNKDAHPLIFKGANINWKTPAFHNGKEIKDKEWQFQFLRLKWWYALAKAYQYHKDEKYFLEWRYEMVDFAEDVLPINDDTQWSVKRGMETYYRCQMIRKTIPYFIQSDNFDAKTLLYLLNSFHGQAEHIRTIYAEKGNHLLGELINVFENGMAFPEFKKSEEWKQDAITKIPERMFIEIFSDGMNNEFVFSYHSMYLSIFTDAYMAFKKYDYTDNLPKEYIQRLENMADIYMHHMFPDFTISQFGDSWKNRDAARTYTKVVSRFSPQNPNLEFVKSKGKRGAAPKTTSMAYPESGFFFFRSDWTKDAVFMSMKNNPGYAWHSQFDNQTFELYAYGKNLMIDSGSYVYNSDDPEEQYQRKWFKSSKAHQTLTLDNKDTGHDVKHILWDKKDDLAVLINENQSYENLKHRRTTLFVDNKYFLIYDEAIGTANGKVAVHFNTVPAEIDFDADNFSVATNFGKGANLLVKSFPQSKGVELEKEEGWISYKILRKTERPAWAYCVNKETEKATTFLTALVPFKGKVKLEKITAKVKNKNGILEFSLKVGRDDYKITVDVDDKTTSLKK